jgi:hypothetical protein
MQVGNQQSKYCYFDSLGYMILNPSFNINETIISLLFATYLTNDITKQPIDNIESIKHFCPGILW